MTIILFVTLAFGAALAAWRFTPYKRPFSREEQAEVARWAAIEDNSR